MKQLHIKKMSPVKFFRSGIQIQLSPLNMHRGLSFIELLILIVILSSISTYTLQQLTRMKEEVRYTEVKTLHGALSTAVTVYNMLWNAQTQNALTQDALGAYQVIASNKGYPLSPSYDGVMNGEDCAFVLENILEPAPNVSHISEVLSQESIDSISDDDVHFIAHSPDGQLCDYTYIKDKPDSGEATYKISYHYTTGDVLLAQTIMP